MSTIIVQCGQNRRIHPDVAAQRRADRLAMATPEQMETALESQPSHDAARYQGSHDPQQPITKGP